MREGGIEPGVRMLQPTRAVYQVRYRHGGRTLLFFSNQGDGDSTLAAALPAGDGVPWRWDPESGERTRLELEPEGRVLRRRLGPHESLLVIVGPAAAGARAPAPVRRPAQPAVQSWRLPAGPWTCRFHPVQGAPFSREIAALADLGKSRDGQLRRFSGQIDYSIAFDAPEGAWAQLVLGEVRDVSEVRLNGTALGVRWYGAHRYDLREALRPGRNELRVRVTTTTFNYAASLEGNQSAARWAGRGRPVPSGLIGPVALTGGPP
jgi:hypothetical protein